MEYAYTFGFKKVKRRTKGPQASRRVHSTTHPPSIPILPAHSRKRLHAGGVRIVLALALGAPRMVRVRVRVRVRIRIRVRVRVTPGASQG